jgi:uncharacterized protein
VKFFLLSCFLFLSSANANTANLKIPELNSPVIDEAQLFTESEEVELNQLAVEIFNKGGPQFAILTVENLQGYAIEEYSIRVAEAWKLGTKEKDNGLLLIIAKSERSVRLEVGNGIEGDITDFDSSQYTQYILPAYFKQGDFYLGVKKLLIDVAEKFAVSVSVSSSQSFSEKYHNRNNGFAKSLLFLMGIIFILSSIFFPRRPVLRGIFAGLFLTLVCLPFALALIWYVAILIAGIVGGLINLGNFLLSVLGVILSSRGHSGAGRGHWGGGGSWGSGGGGWSGGGGGFSGGGSSGRW